MNSKTGTKAVGFYFVIVAAVLAVVSLVRFLMWAPQNNASDMLIVAALVVGLIADVVMLVKDIAYLNTIATACYSIAAVKIFTDSVGSFVDAFQGINMFGDATQVGTIISIGVVMWIGVLVSIIASFLKKVK
jgi:hypothetical protein